jgi:hypothetical protein
MITQYPEIRLPDSVELDGEEGEAMVHWRKQDDGTICLTEFEGVPLGKAKSTVKKSTPPSEASDETPTDEDENDDNIDIGARLRKYATS